MTPQRSHISTANPLQTDTLVAQQAGSQIQQEQTVLQRDTLTTTGIAQHKADDTTRGTGIAGSRRRRDQSRGQPAQPGSRQPAGGAEDETRTDVAQPRVRRLTAASAKQSVDAAYLLDWRRRLEAVGNQYYPEASVRYGMYGDLRMLVVIRQDGSLEDIQMLSSSGYAVLDEAAIKIVRMAAPYSPFPPELKATTDKLEIVRTWHFQENQLSSP